MDENVGMYGIYCTSVHHKLEYPQSKKKLFQNLQGMPESNSKQNAIELLSSMKNVSSDFESMYMEKSVEYKHDISRSGAYIILFEK